MVRLMILGLVFSGSFSLAFACPFCTAPSYTLSEEIEQATSVQLLELKSRPTRANRDSTERLVGRFRVIDEFKPRLSRSRIESAAKSERHDLSSKIGARPVSGDKELQFQLDPEWRSGDLFALIQRKQNENSPDVPIPVSRSGWRYLTTLPSHSIATPDRLRFFVRYLEHSDTLVANDAYGEFANAPYKEIVAMRESLPRHRLRQWILDSRRADQQVIATRRGLYGMLLGLCGTSSDAALLRRVIVDDWNPDDGFRLGIDGMIGGYLLLTGDTGLKLIEQSKLANTSVPFAETYAAMRALRFAWTYGSGSISRDQLRMAMRHLLKRPELADLVIVDLARWKDWEVQPLLMQMYGEEAYQVPAIKRAIIRFMLANTLPEKATRSGDEQKETQDSSRLPRDSQEEPAHVQRARRYLAILKARDPKLVADCERFFFFK